MRPLRLAAASAALLLAAETPLAIAARTQSTAPQAPVAAPPTLPPGASETTPTSPAATHPLSTTDLEAFFDGIFPLQIERSDIAGASVLVTQNGNVLLQKGYGYADWKARKPVDPATTIFRLASISKLFTWISVMQLVEQGRLNLDTDINQYLDFHIRPAFGRPITLRDLMTHTGGFEEELNELIVTGTTDPVILRDDLIRNQPMRIFPPGQVPAYSNYGVGLASYIVQRASGQPFAQYVEQHIFQPLGMTHSSFDQPLQKNLTRLVSEGYRASTIKPPVGFEIFDPVGAGGVSSTAADMGRFGQMLLNAGSVADGSVDDGSLDGHQILKPETLAEMWKPQYQASPDLPPICMGFYQNWRNNLHWIGHEGDLIAFHSLFFVEPQQKLVLFVSYNSAGAEEKARPEIINFFSDRYFPADTTQRFVSASADEIKAMQGRYQSTRRADSTKLKLLYLFDQRSARVDKDGVLTLSGIKDMRGHPMRFKSIGKDLWQQEDGQERLFGIRDGQGRITRIAGGFPGAQLERVPWYENSLWVLPATHSALGILALVVLASFIRTGRRLFLRRRTRPVPQPGTVWLTWAPRLASFVWVALAAAIASYFAVKTGDLMPPTPAWYPWFVALNWVTGVAILLSLLSVVTAIRIWWRIDIRRITKIKFSLVALSCALLSWFAIHWNLIGPAHRI